MTPDEPVPEPIDDELLAQMLACDALLHDDPRGSEEVDAAAAGADERARNRLLLLLWMLESGERPTRQPAADAGELLETTRPLLGRFDILEDLGAGGFGFVVKARDRLLGREVALKMPLPERVLAPGHIDRFLREAQAAGRLDHPHIVRVYDAGELGPLGYFIASEFCEGPSLRQWMKEQGEAVPPRLAAVWLAALADAVQHAHDRGILHRDIKPDNIIMAPGARPGEMIPRLTDFGLAKLIEPAGQETQSGAQMGTPHYMAPEQASGHGRQVGAATDIYAMGATLYELLTGRPPFRGESEAQTLRLIVEEEPIPPRSLRPGLPRDLETICLKCLRKEPARRYAAASDLRDDLQRFLGGRPIVGRPVSARERASRWTRQRPAVAALVATVVLLACGLVGGFAWWASWLRWHNHQLELEVARADRHALEAEKQTKIAEERRRLADRHRHADGLRRARQALDARQIELAQDILHAIEPEPGTADSREFAWRYLRRQAHREFTQLRGHDARITAWTVSPDGKSLATRDRSSNVLVWDLARGADATRPLAVSSSPHPELCLFSPDGRYLARLVSAPPQTAIHLIEAATGRQIARLGPPAGKPVSGFCFDAEGRRAALLFWRADGEGVVRVWDLDSAGMTHHDVSIGSRFTHGHLAVTGQIWANRDRSVVLIDPWTGARQAELHLREADPPPGVTVLSASGQVAATYCGAVVIVWETSAGGQLGRHTMTGGIRELALSSTGAYAAVMDDSGYITIFDRATSRWRPMNSGPKRTLFGQSLSFAPKGSLLVFSMGTTPGGVQPPEVWDVADNPRRLALFPGRLGTDPGFLPDGRTLVVLEGPRPIVWRLDAPAEPDALGGHSAEVWAAAFSPDGRILATGSDDDGESRTIKLWDPRSGQSLGGWKGHSATVTALAFHPGGQVLASASLGSGQRGHDNVTLWDVAARRPLASLTGHTSRVRAAAFSPDGATLATCGDDRTIRLWDVAGRTTRTVLTGHTDIVSCLAFHPDGTTLATGSNDGSLRTWDVATGRPRLSLPGASDVRAVAYAPDGGLMATAEMDGTIRIREPSRGEVVRKIPSEADELRCLTFTRDGRDVVAAGLGRVIRIWDLTTGQEVLTLDGHQDQVNALAFSPDGATLASCGHDGAVKLWRAGPIEP